jgi:acetoin utilization protein AcuB
VIEENQLVGMITEADLFNAFLEVLGARLPGVRLAVLVNIGPGQLARLTQAVFNAGGNIISLGTFSGPSSETGEILMKVDGLKKDVLVELVKPYVVKILNVREKEIV